MWNPCGIHGIHKESRRLQENSRRLHEESMDSMRNEWGVYTEILMDSMDSTRIPQGFCGMDGIHEEYVGECKLLLYG